jgi:hypothetical protein
MNKMPTGNFVVFQMLCKVLGGQDQTALNECIAAMLLPRLFDMARSLDLLPALAVRCSEQNVDTVTLGEEKAGLLERALMDNTLRNMKISAQALKLTRQLNQAGISPLFLKGAAQLLTQRTGNIGFRKQVDIDLIVQPGEIKAAGDVFLADGYSFCQFPGNSAAVPITPGDTASAIKLSAAHHHLPPLVKNGYAATVELHRHFLDRRFQRGNPLEALFSTAHQVESHGATFQVPATEYQIIHLVLGKLRTDGHLARRTFPIREACDFIELLENAEGEVNQQLVLQHCGRSFPLFYALVCELMAYPPRISVAEPEDTANFTWMMQKRFESIAFCTLLDVYARADYLVHALAHSPAKLPAYLHRILSPNQP